MQSGQCGLHGANSSHVTAFNAKVIDAVFPHSLLSGRATSGPRASFRWTHAHSHRFARGLPAAALAPNSPGQGHLCSPGRHPLPGHSPFLQPRVDLFELRTMPDRMLDHSSILSSLLAVGKRPGCRSWLSCGRCSALVNDEPRSAQPLGRAADNRSARTKLCWTNCTAAFAVRRDWTGHPVLRALCGRRSLHAERSYPASRPWAKHFIV
jgi:hypothetical protein